MTEQELQKLKYPIGQFECLNNISKEHIESWISILEHFPTRLENLVKNLSDDDLNKYFIHPETNSKVPLNKNIGIYAWHSNHHYAHIENLLKQKGWQ